MNKTEIPREGYTTGACAAAAAKAATMLLCGAEPGGEVEIAMPGGGRLLLPIADSRREGERYSASVIKDAGDDPDVTNGMAVVVEVGWHDGTGIVFFAGDGVGTVTKKGLSIPPSEPAINPVPRRMIRDAVREITQKPVRVTISIPGGVDMAKRTFNPRLGIAGGLSILGTTGIVRPYSHPALKESLKCSLDVTLANGVSTPVFTAGNIGARAARKHFDVASGQVIEVGNEWGFMLDCMANHKIDAVLAVGHPGKLAKLADGEWDTHSSRSKSAVPFVMAVARELFGFAPEDSQTVEGILSSLTAGERETLSRELSKRIKNAIVARTGGRFEVAVALVDMGENITGYSGNTDRWIKKNR
jgi:cobalt-precorrin-5B (C1)-methyltransferase